MQCNPIVLVDDESQVRSLIRRALLKRGLAVVEAQDGVHALEVMQELNGNVSLLLSDIDMPRLDGGGLCKAVKERYPTIRVLLMSGNPKPEQLEAGDAFLRKPFSLDALLSLISDLCSRSRSPATADTTPTSLR